MSYEQAFAAVPGVKVVYCEYFGSYSGRLLAKIEVADDPEPKYILDYFGSCSYCDAYESAFDWDSDRDPEFKEKLASFGKSYVDAAMTLNEAIKEVESTSGWMGEDEREMLMKLRADLPPVTEKPA